MKKLVKSMITAASMLVLAIAAVAASAPCVIYYYQPEMPHDIKERLAILRK